MIFTGDEHPAVAMPVGGLGTGSMAMGADGGWRQIQLHGLGNHHGDLPGTFLALRTMQHEPQHDSTVILQQQRSDPGSRGHPATPMYDDDLVPGWQSDLLRRVGGTVTQMRATYPIAEVTHDVNAPVEVQVRVTSPWETGDAEASGIPAIAVNVTLTNPSDAPIRTWLAHSVHNAVGLDPHVNPRGVRAPGYGGNVNTWLPRSAGDGRLVMSNPSVDPTSDWAGQMVLGCQAQRVVSFPCFSEPDELIDAMRLLAPWGDVSRASKSAAIQIPQTSAPSPRFGPSPSGQTWLGALIGFNEIAAGASATVRFVLTWHFPNRMVDFVQFGPDRPELGGTRFWLGNHYAQQHPDAVLLADQVLTRWEHYWQRAQLWVDVMRRASLPASWVDHVAAQPAALRTPTVFRAADSRWYGFEGVLGASTRMWSGDVGGSCPLNCTHVWNYAQAAAAIFPEIERSMRETEWDVMLAPSGALPHRVYMPPYLRQMGDGPIGGPEAPALDGMCGAVLKTYRELRRGTVDRAWLEVRWGKVCRLMDHISETWDPDNTGLLHGIQPSTHDIGLHGANPFMGTYWLAALRAAERMAGIVGESSHDWPARFQKASTALDETCFNGEYYIQVPDAELELTHQFGEGCLADQLIGQWWAHQLDLGYLLPADHVRRALGSVVEYNLREAETSGMRPYALPGEFGVVMCTWPRGGRPEVPTMYCDEVWTGSEYQLASHLLYEGMAAESHQVLRAMWQRHDGRCRNPFNHVECGDHYARAMSGWSLLEAALDLRWDAIHGVLHMGVPGYAPVLTANGWGEVNTTDGAQLRCYHGELAVTRIETSHGAYRHCCLVVTPDDGWVTYALEG